MVIIMVRLKPRDNGQQGLSETLKTATNNNKGKGHWHPEPDLRHPNGSKLNNPSQT